MRRLLIVDDEPLILEVAQMSLEVLGGWRVSTASSGAQALAMAAAERPDAILMDVMMPGMDGPTACRHLFDDPETSQIPVILLTAKVQQSEQRQWEHLPLAGVLAKPFDPLTLPATIAGLLGWSEGPGDPGAGS